VFEPNPSPSPSPSPSPNQVFGFHEIFHTSVILGHSTSMIFDLLWAQLR